MKITSSKLCLTLLLTSLAPAIGRAQTCNSMIQSLATWMTTAPPFTHRDVTAYVSSHGSNHSVTYSAVAMKPGTSLLSGWLLTKTAGKQYFSEKTYCLPPGGLGCTEHPFSPYNTKTLTLTVTPVGQVSVKPNSSSTAQTFAATCKGSIMYGIVSTTVNLGGFPFIFYNPEYTITFKKTEWEDPK